MFTGVAVGMRADDDVTGMTLLLSCMCRDSNASTSEASSILATMLSHSSCCFSDCVLAACLHTMHGFVAHCACTSSSLACSAMFDAKILSSSTSFVPVSISSLTFVLSVKMVLLVVHRLPQV